MRLLGQLSFEGIVLLSDGTVYYGDELRPSNGKPGGGIYKFVLVLHILCASVYALLGAFQFAPAFRRRRPGWHRRAGRLLVPAGLLVGLSGLWMTLFYPRAAGTGRTLVLPTS